MQQYASIKQVLNWHHVSIFIFICKYMFHTIQHIHIQWLYLWYPAILQQYVNICPYAATRCNTKPCATISTIQSILKQYVTIFNHMHRYATVCNCSVQEDITENQRAQCNCMHHNHIWVYANIFNHNMHPYFAIICKHMQLCPIICNYLTLNTIAYIFSWMPCIE